MPKLVLIVEDSDTCAETLQIAIEGNPRLNTLVAHNPEAALLALRHGSREVAAVVTDLHLREADGLELVRTLRAEPEFAALPVVLISGDSDPGLPERAIAEGANAFFAKPYSPAAVRKKLEELLVC
jgi:CheY-like chemotaxis protein